MPHKITLTGSATGPLREYDRYVAFDMREKGSPSAPKGLKKSTFISYTVFVAKKAFNKTGLTKKSIMHEKILIQGEPTLDIPIDECPGEVGVICFQITVLPALLMPQVEVMYVIKRAIFFREQLSKMYSTFTFTLSMIIAEMPYSVLCAVLFFLPLYYIPGFQMESARAGYQFFMILITEVRSITWRACGVQARYSVAREQTSATGAREDEETTWRR